MEQEVHHDRALEIALGKPLEKNVETIQFNQANGRVLANPLSSHVDDPRFDNSAMDGFAVRASDCKEGPTILTIVGVSPACDRTRAGMQDNDWSTNALGCGCDCHGGGHANRPG